jgi:hypothetical protein
MSPEHRSIAAFVAACLHTGRVFTHVYDHDAARLIAVGGVVGPDAVDVVNIDGRRFSGPPGQLYDHRARTYLQVATTGSGFNGFDPASGKHVTGVFAGPLPEAAIQLFDHETGRYHSFHVS